MKPINRRKFLRAGASTAIALPWLEAFSGKATAADLAPLRFVVVMHANGVSPSDWWPDRPGQDYALKSSLQPLEAFKERMLLLGGIHNKSAKSQSGNPHSKAAPHLLTGAPHIEGQFDKGGGGGFSTSISFDQELAARIQGPSPIPSLLTGVVVGEGDNGETCRARISYAGNNKPLTPQDKPSAVLQKLVGFLSAGDAAGQGPDPAEVARLLEERRSVLDLAARDIEALLPKLGSADKARLEEHLEHLRAVEKSIGATTGGATPVDCMAPPVSDGGNIGAVTKTMFDLLSFSLACDLTRVATFQFAGSQSTINYSSLIPGVKGDAHHSISHDGPLAEMGKIARYHSQLLAGLLTSLDAAKEGDRSVLDNTIVLYVNDLSEGSTHSFDNLPIALIGGTGKLAGGRYLQYDDASQNDLFITLAQVFGIELPTFGDARHVKGPLAGLLA